MVILKIPIVYLCWVVWWAVKSKPLPEEPAALQRVPVVPRPWNDPRQDIAREKAHHRPDVIALEGLPLRLRLGDQTITPSLAEQLRIAAGAMCGGASAEPGGRLR